MLSSSVMEEIQEEHMNKSAVEIRHQVSRTSGDSLPPRENSRNLTQRGERVNLACKCFVSCALISIDVDLSVHCAPVQREMMRLIV